MPTILFAHDNFPAQFGGLGEYLVQRGWNVVFATHHQAAKPGKLIKLSNGVCLAHVPEAKQPADGGHSYLRGTDKAIRNGQAFVKTAIALNKGGFKPDVIVAHSGWGSGSFLKIVWPDAKLIQYLEWWYKWPAVDVPIDTSLSEIENLDNTARTLSRNLPFLLDMQQSYCVLSPTAFQAAQIPEELRVPVHVQHDGIDCELHRPREKDEPAFSLPNLPTDAQIVTFATRGMEPLRGFPTFMEASSKLMTSNKDVHVVIAGEPSTHYSKKPTDTYKTWKDKALAELPFDLDRLHFTGRLPRSEYAKLLQRTDAHAYLTRPFVLSWSFIEAMATGCPLVATHVEPVREALGRSDCARLVPMDDAKAVLTELQWCLDNPDTAREMGLRAREEAAARYDKKLTFPALEALVSEAAGYTPPHELENQGGMGTEDSGSAV